MKKYLVATFFIFSGVISLSSVIAHATPGAITFSTSGSLRESVYTTTTITGTFAMNPAPVQDVVFNFSTNGQCGISGAGSSGSFTGYAGQQVGPKSVYSIDDNSIEGNHTCAINYTLSSSDIDYNGQSGTANVSMTDNDATPGFNLSKPSSINEGDAATFSVLANDDPTNNITFAISVAGPCTFATGGGKGGSSDLGKSFNATMYPGQESSISYAIKSFDDSTNSSQQCAVSFTQASSSDSNYNGKTVSSFSVTIVDNDSTGSSNPSSPSSSGTTATPLSAIAASSASRPVAPVSSDIPAIDSLSELKVNGSPIKEEKVEFQTGRPIVLSGKTIPDGIVTIYVYSEPKQYTVTADKNGVWSVEIKSLPVGNHHAEIEVTDSKTKQTSKRSQLLAFSVVGITNAALVDNQKAMALASKQPNMGLLIVSVIGGVIVLASLALAAIIRFKPELFAKAKDKCTNLANKFRKHPQQNS